MASSRHSDDPPMPFFDPVENVQYSVSDQSVSDEEAGDLPVDPPHPAAASASTAGKSGKDGATVANSETGNKDAAGKAVDKEPGLFVAILENIFFGLIYVPFTYAVLMQSFFTGVGVDTNNWEDEMKMPSWVAAHSVTISLLAYPWILAYVLLPALLTESLSSLQYGIAYGAFLAVLAVLKLMTIRYTNQRPQLNTLNHDGKTLRLTPANIVGIANIGFEVVQLISPFILRTPLSPLVVKGVVRLVTFDVDPGEFGLEDIDRGNVYITISWCVIGIVGVYMALVGRAIRTNAPNDSFVAQLLFGVFASTLYVSLVSRLLTSAACHPVSPVIGATTSSSMRWETEYLPGVECFSGTHAFLLAVSMVCLVLYSSTALFSSVYRGDVAGSSVDIRYLPRFLVISKFIKFLFCLVTILIPDDLIALGIALLLVLALFAFTFTMEPCSLDGINTVRQGSLILTLVIGVGSYISLFAF